MSWALDTMTDVFIEKSRGTFERQIQRGSNVKTEAERLK